MSEYFMSKNEVIAELSELEKQGAELLLYRNGVWFIRENKMHNIQKKWITIFNTQQDGICEIDIIKATDLRELKNYANMYATINSYKHSKSIYPLTFKEQIDLYKAGK